MKPTIVLVRELAALVGEALDAPPRHCTMSLFAGTSVSSTHRGSGASRTRTGDPLGAIQVLSQLSYSPAERRL
jgi:hypothetical protein